MYIFQEVHIHIHIFVVLYIVLRAKIFENFLELKLVEMHNNLKQVCICQFYHRLTWQGKGSLIIAHSWSSEFQITIDRAIDRNCPQLGVKWVTKDIQLQTLLYACNNVRYGSWLISTGLGPDLMYNYQLIEIGINSHCTKEYNTHPQLMVWW